jgi:hypothetical protein
MVSRSFHESVILIFKTRESPMKKQLLAVAFAASSVFAANTASALTIPSGYSVQGYSNPTTSGVLVSGAHTNETFTDTISFSLNPGVVSYSVFAMNFSNLGFNPVGISNLSVAFYKAGSNALIATGTSFSTIVAQAAASYTAIITGSAPSGATSTYSGIFTSSPAAAVSPVPEPATYAMMLAGLAIVGFAATRKKTVNGSNAV